MLRKFKLLLNCSLFLLAPAVAGAAGTYYSYEGTVQRNYGGYNANNGGSFYNYGPNNRYQGQQKNTGCRDGSCDNDLRISRNSAYDTRNTNSHANKNTTYSGADNRTPIRSSNNTQQGKGIVVDAALSHQFAMWKFDMATAGSKLHYDNLNWNVFDAKGQYDFDWGNNKLRLDGGLQYGMQYGESSMVDDDITSGGYLVREWDVSNLGQTWSQVGRAMSVGTSSGGNMMGVYAGLGMVDMWHVGGAKITPSVGYRYFKYKLETKNNYGISLDTIEDYYCISDGGGEVQCLPFVVFIDSAPSYSIGTVVYLEDLGVYAITVPSGVSYVETQNSYYYHQDGVSHSYQVEWTGPYLALDLSYDITDKSAVNARLELGLPAYTATADQPFRPDWQHPKSLEDKGGIGDAFHLGLGANWMHYISDSTMLTLGMTFDYYHISNANATSYFNSEWYTFFKNLAIDENNTLEDKYSPGETWSEADQAKYAENLETIDTVNQLAAKGWKQEVAGEIESLYKSMGIRIGLQTRF